MGASRLCSQANQRNWPFPNLCHCVCIYQHPVLLFCSLCCCCLFFFSCSFLSSELRRRQCRLVAPPFSAGPLAAMLRRTRRQDLSLCWWIKLSYPRNDWPCQETRVALMKRVLLTTLAGSYSFLCSPCAPCFSFTQLVESHLVVFDNVIDPFFFLPPSPFFGQTFWTVHWQILYKIAI